MFFKRTISKLSDEELLTHYAQSGDTEYFGELYNRYIPLLYGLCLKYLQDEDRAQEAVMQLFEDLLPKFSLRVEDKGGKFSAYLEADQDEVLADEVHVTNVISNLVDNAIKYCVKPPEITIYTRNKDKEIIISVIDNGIGIAKKDQKLIFERFYRVDKSHSREIGGTGLGLAIARSAVVMHRGAIKVFSQPSEGTTFTVRIPLNYVS